MKPGNSIAALLGMTRTELAAVSFLLLVFIAGLIIRSGSSFPASDMAVENKPEIHFTDAYVDSLLQDAQRLEQTLPLTSRPNIDKVKQQDHISDTGNHSTGIVFSSATAEQLASMPGISSVLADRLIAFRNSREGKVDRFEDFLEVTGIGTKRVETLKKHLILD